MDKEISIAINLGNWVQINNTVVPVVHRNTPGGHTEDYVSLAVIRHGAGLVIGVAAVTVKCTTAERARMSKLCSEAGFHFDFPADTELIRLSDIGKYNGNNVHIASLPNEDPFSHACFLSDKPSPVDKAVAKRSVHHVQSGHISTYDETKATSNLRPNGRKPHTKTPGIWRPVPFGSDDSKSDMPLDLSTKMIDNVSSSTTTCSVHQRCMLGKEVTVVVQDSIDYVPFDTVQNEFFPRIPMETFMNVVAAIGVPLLDITAIKGNLVDHQSSKPYFQTTRKMMKYQTVGDVVTRIESFLKYMMHCRTGSFLSLVDGHGPDANHPKIESASVQDGTLSATESAAGFGAAQSCSQVLTSRAGNNKKKMRLLDTVDKLQNNETLQQSKDIR